MSNETNDFLNQIKKSLSDLEHQNDSIIDETNSLMFELTTEINLLMSQGEHEKALKRFNALQRQADKRDQYLTADSRREIRKSGERLGVIDISKSEIPVVVKLEEKDVSKLDEAEIIEYGLELLASGNIDEVFFQFSRSQRADIMWAICNRYNISAIHPNYSKLPENLREFCVRHEKDIEELKKRAADRNIGQNR